MKSFDSVVKILKTGFVTQKEIQAITNLSQATVSRCLKKLIGLLLVLPDSSPREYSLPDANTKKPFQLGEVDEHGKESLLGNVYALSDGKYFVNLFQGGSKLYLGDKGNGLFNGLPFFLYDLKPQGFLGNQFVKQLAGGASNYPKYLSLWSSSHIFQFLIEYGDDLPGNLKFGDSVRSSLRQPISPIGRDSYDFMCQQMKEGKVPKSSAGGEQQKFTAFNKEINAHVIVKYTSNENDAVTRRWKDVLVTEYHALKILQELKLPAADVRLIDQDNRFYLETKRFDRLGNYGRSSMFSLQAIDLEYTGLGENWQQITRELTKLNLLSETDRIYTSTLWQFSKLIANTDTHLGNISFGIKGDSFSLLPIYDMCSMGIAPKINSLDPISFTLPEIDSLNISQDYKKVLINVAIKFWQRVEDDARISNEFRVYLNHYNPVKKLKTYFY